MENQLVVLTGDRPSGPLHIGHYVGSLQKRVELQDCYTQYVMIADIQALTDHYEYPEKVHESVFQVMLDYLAVGIDPQKTTIFIQSMIPQIAELAILYLNFVTVNRLKRNPTVKLEIQQKGFGESLTAGFLTYPVHQAADITIVNGTLIPVGEDQLPMVEQTNEIVRAFNRLYKTSILREAKPLISAVPRLPGIDGKTKMSKSLGNAIFFSDTEDILVRKVMSMFTDPNHIHVSDPGNVEGNTVFTYLDIFDPDKEAINELKLHYRRGGLGDVAIKKRLIDVLNAFILPIATRRKEFQSNRDHVMQLLLEGTAKVQDVAEKTMKRVKSVMHLLYN